MMKKIFFYFILIYILLNFTYTYAWWDSNWQYRQKIIINNKANYDIPKDFTINYTLNTKKLISEGKMKQDCSDIRIIENNSIIDRLILNCNNNNTEIQFKLNDNIEKYDDSYYIYYGNRNADYVEMNKSNVYYFYDDFEGYNLGQSSPFDRWYSDGGNWTIDNSRAFSGQKSLFENGLIIRWKTINNTKVNIENFTYIAYGMIGKQDDVWSFALCFDINNSINDYRLVWFYQIGIGGWSLELRNVTNGIENKIAGTPPNSFIPQLNKWYEFKVIRSYPNIKVFINNSLIFDVNDSTFNSGSIGFCRYSNIADPTRTSWYDDPTVMLYMEPWPEVILGEEETFNKLKIYPQISPETFVNNTENLNIQVFHDNQPITNLTLSNFNITDVKSKTQIVDFKNYNNGSYQIKFKMDSRNLGKHKISISINQFNSSGFNETETFLLEKIKDNILIITNEDWKNYISSTSTSRKVQVYNQTTRFIDYIINEQRPNQIFILSTDLSLDNSYYLDDLDTLALLFFKNQEIVVPKNKETAIASSMLEKPILFNISQQTLSLLNPQKIYLFNSTSDVDFYLSTHFKKPTNYIVLVNPNSDRSMFAVNLAFKKHAFVIQSTQNAQQSKTLLKQKLKGSNLYVVDPFLFFNQVFVTLIDVPYFLVEDPIDDVRNDYDGEWLETDTPYGDLNDDNYLDISVGRLEGSLDYISYQLEAQVPTNKEALIVASYSTNSRFMDLMTGGATMIDGTKISAALVLRGFKVTRMVEKRSSYDEINSSVVKEFIDVMKDFTKGSNSYDDFLSIIISAIEQIRLLLETGYEIVYALMEFDWNNAWKNFVKGNPFTVKHLPEYNEENLKKEIPDKSVIIYLGNGNSTHWFQPNSTENIIPIKIETFPFNPSLYYIHYTKGLNSFDEISNVGSIATIGSTGNVYMIQSSHVGHKIFTKFNGPVGVGLKEAKNDIFEFYESIENSSFPPSPKPYKKEYYTRNLIGDPSVIFDPSLELRQSSDVKIANGNFIQNFEINSEYSIVVNKDNRSIYFHNPYSFVFENGKPILPVFKNSIILPTSSKVKSISVDVGNEKMFDDLKVPISIPDPNYFDPVNFTGQFPENFYWSYAFDLLDNRSNFDFIFIPVTYYSNNSALVYESINVELIYSSLLEITKINATDTVKNQPATISLDVYSNLANDANAVLSLLISTESSEFVIKKEVLIKKGLNEIKVDWLNTSEIGYYSVQAVLTSDGFTIGPKYTYFQVKERRLSLDDILPFFRNFYLNAENFIKNKKNFSSNIKKEIKSGKEVIEYTAPDMKLRVEIELANSTSVLTTPKAKLVVQENPNSKKYELTTPEGFMILEKTKGMTRQFFVGDPKKLTVEINENIDLYNSILEKINAE